MLGDVAQGYAIARPMPAEEIPAWLQAYRPDPAWVALASQTLTVPDAVLLLTDLALSQWCKRLLDALDTPSGQSPHWPIMRCESSHCGWLLERAKKEELFTKAQVQSLDESVRALHVTGNQLMRAYLDQTSDHLAQGRKTLTDQLQGIRSMLQDLTSASER